MTIDERIQFLIQSGETLHADIRDLYATTLKRGEQIDKTSEQIARHSEQLAIDSENIRTLARIAEIHNLRLESLERGSDH